MIVVEIDEFEHFVSFVLEGIDGKRAFVQFRRDQVWLDRDGNWTIGEDTNPSHIHALPPSPKPKISNALLLVLLRAAGGLLA